MKKCGTLAALKFIEFKVIRIIDDWSLIKASILRCIKCRQKGISKWLASMTVGSTFSKLYTLKFMETHDERLLKVLINFSSSTTKAYCWLVEHNSMSWNSALCTTKLAGLLRQSSPPRSRWYWMSSGIHCNGKSRHTTISSTNSSCYSRNSGLQLIPWAQYSLLSNTESVFLSR